MLLIFSLLSQECIFKKASDNTALRVYWAGNLRIVNCDACCSRWYFTFNGAECSTPAAIDGVVYMRHGRGSKYKDLLRPRHIEGSQGHGARWILGREMCWVRIRC